MVFSDLGDQGTAGHARKLVAANPRPFKPGELNEAPGILGGVRKIGIHLATALMLAGRAIAAALTYGGTAANVALPLAPDVYVRTGET